MFFGGGDFLSKNCSRPGKGCKSKFSSIENSFFAFQNNSRPGGGRGVQIKIFYTSTTTFTKNIKNRTFSSEGGAICPSTWPHNCQNHIKSHFWPVLDTFLTLSGERSPPLPPVGYATGYTLTTGEVYLEPGGRPRIVWATAKIIYRYLLGARGVLPSMRVLAFIMSSEQLLFIVCLIFLCCVKIIH